MIEWEGAPNIFEKQKNEYLAKAEIFMVLHSTIYSRNIYWAFTLGLYRKINLKFQIKE